MSETTQKVAKATPSVVLRMACICALSWSGWAQADCPNSSPCETIHVYRLQSWPTIRQDASGRPLISLQEANAADAAAFKSILSGVSSTSTALAIRYDVTRIADAPNDYCECNLETGTKGCPSSLPADQLKQCSRVCRRSGAASCPVAGFNTKSDGGKWYAFPVATLCGGNRNVWKKNAFGNAKPSWCDWSENSRVIKQASCLAAALKTTPTPTLDALFNHNAPCAAVSEATLQYLQ